MILHCLVPVTVLVYRHPDQCLPGMKDKKNQEEYEHDQHKIRPGHSPGTFAGLVFLCTGQAEKRDMGVIILMHGCSLYFA
ncbi:MAG: hypothetical protein D5S03_05600 [Desulfonatronospira sp. MSAO_Bac3]|nr:MAG: hypothetical protein D5S03_05600 [Desulfonatronospira sp. MSAO_Bac3]